MSRDEISGLSRELDEAMEQMTGEQNRRRTDVYKRQIL